MIRFFRALLANPFRFKFSLESGDVFLDVGIVWIMVSAFLCNWFL